MEVPWREDHPEPEDLFRADESLVNDGEDMDIIPVDDPFEVRPYEPPRTRVRSLNGGM
jgi:hypothetical protein